MRQLAFFGLVLAFAMAGSATNASSAGSSANTPPLMALPGKSDVDANGGFTYTVPLNVPPGTAGLAPKLSLEYSSRGGDGALGLGWELQLSADSYARVDKLKNQQAQPAAASAGVSSTAPAAMDTFGDIGASSAPGPLSDPYPRSTTFDFPAPMQRCPRTVAQDGVHGSVNYDANDRFCLNGKRLILISGTYGADGSQYRTEIDDFSEIIAHGQSGSGPAWFEVHTKSGQIFQFGNTTDSKAPLVPVTGSTTGPTGTVRVWAVNRISDVQGNYLTVTYNNGTPDTTNGQIYPTQIDYTGNLNASPATTPYNHIYFYYNTTQTRPDVVPTYQAGSLTQTTVLLNEITTYTGTTLVYDYKLSYQLASSNATHDELNSIKLCDATVSCLAPTTFGWQGSRDRLTMTSVPVSLPGVTTPSGTSSGTVNLFNNNFIFGDFNGDGIIDISIIPGSTGGSYINNTQIGTGSAGNFGPAMVSYLPNSPGGTPNLYQSLDINGDGIADLFYQPGGCLASAYYYKSNGTGAFASSGSAPCYTSSSGSVTLNSGSDINGDGFSDYYSTTPFAASNPGLVYAGNGSGTFSNIKTIPNASYKSINLIDDFDGDGCSDILDTYILYFSCGSAVQSVTLTGNLGNEIVAPLSNFNPQEPWLNNQDILGDFNGDGKIDILIVPDPQAYPPPAPNATLYLSTGTGFAPGITIPNSSNWYKYNVTAADWNGDGKSDLLFVSPNDNPGVWNGIGTPHQVWLSTGTGFVQAEDPSGNPITIANNSSLDACSFYPTCITPELADWNNDGAQSILLLKASGHTQYVFAYVPELITTVSNGIGDTTNTTYAPLNQNGALYTKCPSTPSTYVCGDTYPTQGVDAAMYVVSHIDASNGLGTCTPPSLTNCYSTTYAYGGAKKDLSGRGFLGFQQKIETDLQTGIVTTSNYQTAFPFTGYLLSQTEVTTSVSPGCTSGVTLKSTTNTPGAVNLGGTRNFVYTSQSVVDAKDCNGATLPTITTTNQYDCQTNPSACYGELDVATLSRSDGSSETTTRAYSNDTTDWCLDRPTSEVVNSVVGSSNITRTTNYTWTSCLLTQEVEEPGSSTLLLTSTYTPDAFGNVTATAVSGSNIAARSTSTAYDSRGEFPVTTTDELGHVYTYAHDARFGGVTSHTDPNAVTTTWRYDTFGRPANETRPDGTQTQSSYAYCSGVNGGTASCPTNGAYLGQATPTASNGTTQIGPLAIAHYDMLSRNIANDTQGFDASTIRVSTLYDAMGRIAETSRPYFLSGGTPQWTVNTYDALGRVTLAVAPNGGHTTTVYNGLTVSVTNANSETTVTTKNAEGQIASVTDAMSNTTTYAYDAFNDMTSIRDPAPNITSYTYDIRGHKLSSNDPDLGAWTYGYDALGEMTAQTDAKSQHVTLSYDLEGRLISRVEPDLTSTWTYDTAAHGIDKLASATTTAGYQRALSYDSLSRPIQTALTEGGATYTYATSYNATNGQIGAVTYPSGFGVQYVYTALGYLSQINDSTSGQTYWTVNARDAELHLTQQTFGNGVAQTNTFDVETGLLDTVRSGAGNAVAAFDYQYDLLGNLTYRDDTNQGVFEYYCFDPLNRLTSSASGVNGGTVSNCTSSGSNIIDKTIAFDALGDVSSKSDVGTYAYPVAGAHRPHAVSSITGTVNGVVNPTYSYDLNGNMTAGAGRTVTYTSYNMTSALTDGATSLAFTYDSEHARIQQVGPAGTTTYLDDPTSAAMSEQVVNGGAPTVWHDYILAPKSEPEGGAFIAERIGGPGGSAIWGSAVWGGFVWAGASPIMSYFTVDHLASIAVIANAGASVTERDSYDAWGRRRNPNGTDNTACAVTSTTTRGFTGQEMMDTVCTVNLNARIYDPTIARIMAADPVTNKPYDLQNLNRYTYVDNRPLDFTDPTGKAYVIATIDFGLAIGVGATGSVGIGVSYTRDGGVDAGYVGTAAAVGGLAADFGSNVVTGKGNLQDLAGVSKVTTLQLGPFGAQSSTSSGQSSNDSSVSHSVGEGGNTKGGGQMRQSAHSGAQAGGESAHSSGGVTKVSARGGDEVGATHGTAVTVVGSVQGALNAVANAITVFVQPAMPTFPKGPN